MIKYLKSLHLVIIAILFLGTYLFSLNLAAYGFSNGQTATLVLGQPNFTTNISGASTKMFSLPHGLAFDSSGNLWVVDSNNYRVLEFKPPFTTGESASIVIGQPNFISNVPNNGGRTASSLGSPGDVAIDASGNLWISDNGNDRILRYTPPFTNGKAASLVLGVPDFTSAGGAISPLGIEFDSSGNLWVADSGNNRVLRFDAPFTNGEAASLVLGQPNFTTVSVVMPPTARSLNSPSSVMVDSSGNVWVADMNDARLLEYAPPFTNGKAASVVIGQPNFVSAFPDVIGDATLSSPTGVTMDSSGRLWITDYRDGRILEFVPPFTNYQPASLVIGQHDFVSRYSVPGPPTARFLTSTLGKVAFDSSGNLWVSDYGNNRILEFSSQASSVPEFPFAIPILLSSIAFLLVFYRIASHKLILS